MEALRPELTLSSDSSAHAWKVALSNWHAAGPLASTQRRYWTASRWQWRKLVRTAQASGIAAIATQHLGSAAALYTSSAGSSCALLWPGRQRCSDTLTCTLSPSTADPSA